MFSVVFQPSYRDRAKLLCFQSYRLVLKVFAAFPTIKNLKLIKEKQGKVDPPKHTHTHRPPSVEQANIKFDIFSVDPAAGRRVATAQLRSLQLTSLLCNFIQQTARFAQAQRQKSTQLLRHMTVALQNTRRGGGGGGVISFKAWNILIHQTHAHRVAKLLFFNRLIYIEVCVGGMFITVFTVVE